jgi:hypothetical protein
MCDQTYYVYETNGIARYYYDYYPPHHWISASWMSLDDKGRIVRIDTVYARGNRLSGTYEYDGAGRVVRYRLQGPNPPNGDMDDVWEIEYDELGRISKTVWVCSDGTRSTHFERPRPDQTLSACWDVLITGLSAAIVAALKDASPESPVYALALFYYDAEYEHRLPPHVAYATESDLERFRTYLEHFPNEYPGDLPYYAWFPGEWKCNRHLTLSLDEEFAGLCDIVSQDIWQNELYDDATQLSEAIASELSSAELPIPRSPMFTAYVTDLDSGDTLPGVLRFAAPETEAMLREKGLA